MGPRPSYNRAVDGLFPAAGLHFLGSTVGRQAQVLSRPNVNSAVSGFRTKSYTDFESAELTLKNRDVRHCWRRLAVAVGVEPSIPVPLATSIPQSPDFGGSRTARAAKLYGELGLVNLLQLIPSMENYYRQKGYSR